MIKFIQKKTIGTNTIIESHDIDTCILNSENIKIGDYVYVSKDGKNLDTRCHTELRQIFAAYLGNDTVELVGYIEFVNGINTYEED